MKGTNSGQLNEKVFLENLFVTNEIKRNLIIVQVSRKQLIENDIDFESRLKDSLFLTRKSTNWQKI
jgi:hypothetical protein